MPLEEILDSLSSFEPTSFPVLSLYLNTQPDQHGRANFEPFVRKEFRARAKTYPLRSDARESFDRDRERITKYLRDELRPSANGVVIFACAGTAGFFQAFQLDAPIEEHRLYIYHQPHLYPLARLSNKYRRYAALLADTNAARLFVFGIGETLGKERVQNTKVSRTSVGGWSQARYQRHIENYHLRHGKEVVEALDRAVREERIDYIVLAGDQVIVPVLREQLPQHLADKVIDVLSLDITTPEQDILRATLEAMREKDAKDDRDKVERLLDEYRAGGLAVIGVHDTLIALGTGQVDELLVSSSLDKVFDEVEVDEQLVPGTPTSGATEAGKRTVLMADELVTRARQTNARTTFIDEATLLDPLGGVGAMLRYRL